MITKVEVKSKNERKYPYLAYFLDSYSEDDAVYLISKDENEKVYVTVIKGSSVGKTYPIGRENEYTPFPAGSSITLTQE